MNEQENDEEKAVVGISLTSEAYTKDPAYDVALGVVAVKPKHTTLAELRNILCLQIATLPVSFIFLTKQGWPIAKCQEDNFRLDQILNVDNLVRLQRCYEKPRVGIKTITGTSVGFVFTEHNSSISHLREVVRQQLGQIGASDGMSSMYQFLDHNDWPIAWSQESCLSVLDILTQGSVRICYEVHVFGDGVDEARAMEGPPPAKRARYPMLKPLTFQTSKDEERRYSTDSSQDSFRAKQVLISYVRAEAAHNALSLKRELNDIGFSVYLDVHEIKTGIDWQDSLNFAVSHCEVFVPLVTPRYGETQWTNREVKLADVLNKFILPVSFVEDWPPKCLAIQFATTQYIPWKTLDTIREEIEAGEEERSKDIRFWDKPCVQKVAKEIGDRVKTYATQVKYFQRVGTLRKKPSYLRSYASSLPEGCSQHSYVTEDREGKPLVLISLHPKQREYGQQLRFMLEADGYEVWCSTDLVSSGDLVLSQSVSPEAHLPHSASMDYEGPSLSQLSQQLSQETDDTDLFSPTEQDRRLFFQEKADDAGVVIFILSKVFAASRTSRQQVFYCEHRKRVIPLRFEEFAMPGWMSMLIGTGAFEDARREGYKDSLRERVRRALDPSAREGSSEEINEAKIACSANQLKKNFNEFCVYISGGTKFYNNQSEAICQSIGKHLAGMDSIELVTGGFYGVGETVGRSYHENREDQNKASKVWHVLPERDDQDRTRQARQNPDKTFEILPYGKTVFNGSSVREREMTVSRVFDLCILVEGGPGAAHEAEQFAWNDHVVIPVRCTGGAASGKFNVPEKIFKIPPGVSADDWHILENKTACADEIGKAVVRIVHSIKDRLKMDSTVFAEPNCFTSLRSSPRKSPGRSPKKSKTSLARMNTVVLPRTKSNLC